MEKKKKIVIFVSLLIGIAFLYVGFHGIKQKRSEAVAAATAEAEYNQPATHDSDDAFSNISE